MPARWRWRLWHADVPALGHEFPHGLVPTYVPVHPTPIYEFLAAALISLYLWNRGRASIQPRIPPGRVFAEYLLLTGLARFLVEFIRRNPRGWLGLTNPGDSHPLSGSRLCFPDSRNLPALPGRVMKPRSTSSNRLQHVQGNQSANLFAPEGSVASGVTRRPLGLCTWARHILEFIPLWMALAALTGWVAYGCGTPGNCSGGHLSRASTVAVGGQVSLTLTDGCQSIVTQAPWSASPSGYLSVDNSENVTGLSATPTGPRHAPIPHDGFAGDLRYLRGFIDRQTSEKT